MATPRRAPLEKVIQRQIRTAALTIGGTVMTLGRPARADDVHKGTRQTPGLPDLYIFLPQAVRDAPHSCFQWPAHTLWVEVKRAGTRDTRSKAQKDFAALCAATKTPYLWGDLDTFLHYLLERGYVTETAHYRKGSPHGQTAPKHTQATIYDAGRWDDTEPPILGKLANRPG
jgi:hypothetical protein